MKWLGGLGRAREGQRGLERAREGQRGLKKAREGQRGPGRAKAPTKIKKVLLLSVSLFIFPILGVLVISLQNHTFL